MTPIDHLLHTYLTACQVEGKSPQTGASYAASLRDFRRTGRALSLPNEVGAYSISHVYAGDFYSGGYFLEYDQDLRPEERFAINHREELPPVLQRFEPDSEIWPPLRRMKVVQRNVHAYLGTYIQLLVRELGADEAATIVEHAYRCCLFDRLERLLERLQVDCDDPRRVARFLARVLAVLGDQVEVQERGAETIVTQATVRLYVTGPLPGSVEAAIRAAWDSVLNFLDRRVHLRAAATPSSDGRWEWRLRRE